MPDMLVKLYDLPPLEPELEIQRQRGITIRRGMSPEKKLVADWIGQHFSHYWVSEAEAGLCASPPTTMLAQRGDDLLGFACYDTTFKGYFGPTGVAVRERGKGIGTALLLKCLHEMHHAGYMYGIIGWAGPWQYYEKTVDAIVIPDAEPSRSYRGMLGTHDVFYAGAPSDSYLGHDG